MQQHYHHYFVHAAHGATHFQAQSNNQHANVILVQSEHKQAVHSYLLGRISSTACCRSCILHWRRGNVSRGFSGGVSGGCLGQLWGLVTIPHEVQLQKSVVQKLFSWRCLGAVQDEFAQQHQRHRPECNPHSSMVNQACEGECVSEAVCGSVGSPFALR